MQDLTVNTTITEIQTSSKYSKFHNLNQKFSNKNDQKAMTDTNRLQDYSTNKPPKPKNRVKKY
jgi:hypothetical protein